MDVLPGAAGSGAARRCQSAAPRHGGPIFEDADRRPLLSALLGGAVPAAALLPAGPIGPAEWCRPIGRHGVWCRAIARHGVWCRLLAARFLAARFWAAGNSPLIG